MKIQLSAMQVILVGLSTFTAIVLLSLHLFDSTFDHTQEALFFLGLNVPVLMPRSFFDQANYGAYTFFGALFGLLLVWLGEERITHFLLDMTGNRVLDSIIRIAVGAVGFFFINEISQERLKLQPPPKSGPKEEKVNAGPEIYSEE